LKVINLFNFTLVYPGVQFKAKPTVDARSSCTATGDSSRYATARNFLFYLMRVGLLYSKYRIYFVGVKRPGRGVNHPPPSIAEVKEKVDLYLYSPVWVLMACARANTVTF
jgi:hypothetical protein